MPACLYGVNRYGTVSACSGNGACQQGTGRCACYAGYTGDVCSQCTNNYLQLSRGGACIYLPGALSSCTDGVRNGNEKGIDCGGQNCAPCAPDKTLSMTAVIAGASMSAVVCVVLALLIRRWHRRRQSAVVPLKAGSKVIPRQVKLTDTRTRKMTLGKQQSDRARRFSGITPSITIDWTMHERRASRVGQVKGEII